MGQVPAATRTLRVLRFLASQPDPVPLDRITRACGLPRSTAYHLLGAMIEEGFVVHLAEVHDEALLDHRRQQVVRRGARQPARAGDPVQRHRLGLRGEEAEHPQRPRRSRHLPHAGDAPTSGVAGARAA